MELLDPVLDPWRSGVTRRALVEVALLGAVCGPLAFWVRSYRLSYGAESLAHGLLPGLVAAALIGAPLVAGGLAGVAACAVLIAATARDERVGADTATAVVVTGLVGLGALLALARDAPQRLGELLFGDPLAAGDAELLAAACLAAGGGAALAVLHRPLAAVALDGPGAAALGMRAGFVRLALVALLGSAVAVAVRGLGSLLVLALLVAPAAATAGLRGGPGAAMARSAVVAVAAGTAGIYGSYHLGIAAGASVALALCAAAALGAAVTRPARA